MPYEHHHDLPTKQIMRSGAETTTMEKRDSGEDSRKDSSEEGGARAAIFTRMVVHIQVTRTLAPPCAPRPPYRLVLLEEANNLGPVTVL